MSTLLTGPIQSISLPEQETGLARQSSASLAHFAIADTTPPLTLRLENPQTGESMEATVPATAMRLLAHVLAKMAEGHPVTLIPLHAELSTQQAAELLGVSRPYLVKLLEQGKIPFRKVGEQRRVQYRDVVCYLENYQKAAHTALDAMVAENQALGLYE